MNGTSLRTISAEDYGRFDFRKLLFQFGLFLAGATFLFFIIVMKSKRTADFTFEPLLYFYTIFVTTFQLSRLVSAMFYESSYRGSVLVRKKNGASADSKSQLQTAYEPFVTFVVPCMNEEKVIAETINNCFKAEYPMEKMEVIAINDGSTDRTGDILHRLAKQHGNLHVVDLGENQGKKHAMAEGIRRAKGEIIIQLDSDSFINPQSFRKILEPFENPQVGAVSAHTDPKNAEDNFLTKMQAAYYFMSFRVLKAAESTFLTVFCCSGCASAYRKEAILPLLDEWLAEKFLGLPVTWGDDRALTSRVLKLGYKTIYTDRVKAETIVPSTFSQLVRQQIRWKKSWFVNAIYNARFIWKTQPFVAFSYFFPLIGVTFLSPFMAGRALIVLPLFHGTFPVYHVAGIMFLAAIFVAYYRFIAPGNKYWIYYFPWAIFNLFFLSFLIFYALARINDRRWGTR